MSKQQVFEAPGPKQPVFIIGTARSGTTFLAKLMDSHPDVLYRHEPDSVLVNTDIPFLPRREEVPRFVEPARAYLEALLDVRAAKVSGQRPIFEKSFRSRFQKRGHLASLYLAKATEKAGLLGHSLQVADCIDDSRRDSILYLVKSVNSPWRTLLFSQAMPRMRFLHIVRHPCAVINSSLRGIEKHLMDATVYLRQPFEAGMAEGYPFSLEELEAGSYEEKAAFFWMICNQRICDDMAACGNYQTVIYEELCHRLEPTTRRLFDFVGLAWNPQTERFLRYLESADGADSGYFSVMRSPATSVDKWRGQLSAAQIGRIEKIISHSEIGRRFLDASWR